MMTSSELYESFGAWLAPAMRRAGYDIDRQHGGARGDFAKAVGISSATMTRWLAGKAMPGPEKYDLVARTLGYNPVTMLVEIGVISPQLANEQRNPAVRSSPMTHAELADGARIRDPVAREMFFGVLDRLAPGADAPSDQGDGGVEAAEG
jgi:transcriptional regulator with XRE-family HTH domain